MKQPFALDVQHHQRVAVITVDGELDCRTGSIVFDAVRSAQRHNPLTIVLDLSGVTFCDLAGFRGVQRSRRAADRRLVTVGSSATRRIGRLLQRIGVATEAPPTVPARAA
ncbi:MAG TPA: STAS domain-containing protein [Acidimicrobiales bacterium]|jgi:anti-anti-sigma factor|nr:STAS domain-containing protein [Acidimicrobiales bacterium]